MTDPSTDPSARSSPVRSARSSRDVVVLGAGPAGVATALFVAERGYEVEVVERAPAVGGLAGSFEVAGVRVDHGSHRLHPSTPPELLDRLRRMLGPELQVRPRHGRIRLEGRWLGFPLRPADLMLHAPPSLTAGALADLALGPWRRRRPAADTFAARVRAGVGPTVAGRFYEPYAQKLWGIDASALSGELFRRRVGAGSGGGMVRRILRRPGSAGRTFLYPAGGFGRITEAMAHALTDRGGQLRLSDGAARITPGADRVTVTLASGATIDARTVVSTLPGPVTVGLTTDAPGPVRDAAGALGQRGAVLVYLVLPRPAYTEFDAHYFPELSVPIARLSEPKRYRDSPNDPADRTVLCAEIPADAGDGVWRMADEQLGHLVAGALARCGLPEAEPAKTVVRRVPHVYPVYRIGYEQHQEVVETWAATQPGLLLLGRQALFADDNTHHALAMAVAAAACLSPDATVDPVAWARAREDFRHHVVED